MKFSTASSLNCGLTEDEGWEAKKRAGNQDVKVPGKWCNSETHGEIMYIREVKAEGRVEIKGLT